MTSHMLELKPEAASVHRKHFDLNMVVVLDGVEFPQIGHFSMGKRKNNVPSSIILREWRHYSTL